MCRRLDRGENQNDLWKTAQYKLFWIGEKSGGFRKSGFRLAGKLVIGISRVSDRVHVILFWFMRLLFQSFQFMAYSVV